MEGGTHPIERLAGNGIYTLTIFLSKEICLNVGRLGQREFPKGYYTYMGSALGSCPSNLKSRISRHLQKKKRNFWHIDFLLADENATVTSVVAAQTNEKLECTVNSYIKSEGGAKILMKEFGASDCKKKCESHLLFFPDITEEPILIPKIVKYYKDLGLSPLLLHISLFEI